MTIQTTQLFYCRSGSSWFNPNTYFDYWTGSAWVATKRCYRFDGTNWIMRYSTPSVTCSNVSGTNTGGAASGTVTSAAAAPSIGGYGSGSYSYAWTYTSGSAFTISNAASLTPTWSATFAAGTETAVWLLTVTDLNSGAVTTVSPTISLTWVNSTSAIAVTGVNAAGLVEIVSGPASATVHSGTGGASGGATPTGGNGSYTYAWTYVSGDTGITASSASVQHPVWSKAMTCSGGSNTTTSAVWQISLNDTASDGPVTANITVTLEIKSDNAYVPITVVGADASGLSEIAYANPGYVCGMVSTGTGGGDIGGVTPSGGSGTYIYAWTYVSGDRSISINASSIQNPIWTSGTICTGVGSSSTSAVWACAVTDNAGNGPVTVNINVTLTIQLDND